MYPMLKDVGVIPGVDAMYLRIYLQLVSIINHEKYK